MRHPQICGSSNCCRCKLPYCCEGVKENRRALPPGERLRRGILSLEWVLQHWETMARDRQRHKEG